MPAVWWVVCQQCKVVFLYGSGYLHIFYSTLLLYYLGLLVVQNREHYVCAIPLLQLYNVSQIC